MATIYLPNKQANKYSVNSFITHKGKMHQIISMQYYGFRKSRTHTKIKTKKL